MNKSTTLFFCILLLTTRAFAQEDIVLDIKPLEGAAELRLTPGFESNCKKVSGEKSAGGDYEYKATETILSKVLENNSGETKLSITTHVGRNYLRLTTPVKQEGTELEWAEVDIETDMDLAHEDVSRIKRFIPQVIGRASGFSLLGLNLKQGVKINNDFCSIFPGANTINKQGFFEVVGVSIVNGRESIIVSGETSLDCSIGSKKLRLDFDGYYAYDLESGLQSFSSFSGSIESDNGTKEIKEVINCRVVRLFL